MTNDLSAEEVRALLKLEPHATCGFVRVTFISNHTGGLPTSSAGQRAVRPLFMEAPAPPDVEALHVPGRR